MQTIDRVKAFHLLRLSRKKLNRQQYKTLCGQINAGDIEGAMKGLENLLKRNLETPNGQKIGKMTKNRLQTLAKVPY